MDWIWTDNGKVARFLLNSLIFEREGAIVYGNRDISGPPALLPAIVLIK